MKIIKGKWIMWFLVLVDSNMAENFIYFLSAVSDYCMVCFFLKVKKKIWHSSCINERYIYNSMCITCIIIYIYDEYFCWFDVAMQNHWMFLDLVNVTRQCKLSFFYIHFNFIKQNIPVLGNLKSYECHLMKIIKG